MVDWSKYNPDTVNAIHRFCRNVDKCSDDYIINMINDIQKCENEYHITPVEYFCYKFNEINDDVKMTYISTKEYKDTLLNCVKEDKIQTYKNKYLCYEKLKRFYKRDIIKVTDFSDYNNFVDFVSKHKKYIIKVIDGSLGSKISVINVKENDSIKDLFFYALSYGGCVIEEYVQQDASVSAFNESSVNTVRLTTVCDDGNVDCFFTFIKLGRDNAIVDNGGQGGILALINPKDGTVISDGYDEDMNLFVNHPNSNLRIKGFAVPKWNELMDYASDLAENAEGITVIGWDFALTDKGWDIIEANTFPSIFPIQMLLSMEFGCGIREQYNKLLGKYINSKKEIY